MKHSVSFFLLIVLLIIASAGCAPAITVEPTSTAIAPTLTPKPTPLPPTPTLDAATFQGNFHWFGNAAVLYHGSQNIYFDPVALAGNVPPADIILVSHGHTDHWSVADIKKLIGPHTTLIVSPNVVGSQDTIKDQTGIPATILHEGDSIDVQGVNIRAVAAYDTSFHVRASGGLGFVVTIDGHKIYFAGGTNFYPEMAQIESDVAIYPVYARADVEQLVKVLPAKAIILVHNSYYMAQALDILLSKQNSKIQFLTLQPSPFNP
jgi:L-ascorbate metabolism protein UlaG (beta-lactamase superfamily)